MKSARIRREGTGKATFYTMNQQNRILY